MKLFKSISLISIITTTSLTKCVIGQLSTSSPNNPTSPTLPGPPPSSTGDPNTTNGGISSTAGCAASPPPTVGGCALFPGNDAWNRDVSCLPADPTWTAKIQSRYASVKMHPDFGSIYGIPINVVPAAEPLVSVSVGDESDAGPYPFPIPPEARIENDDPTDAANCSGDCHMLVVQQGKCLLYEGWACSYNRQWSCAQGSKFDLSKIGQGQRPSGWTSADAAGLSITAGLVRYAEVQAGAIHHAIRFTVKCSDYHWMAPASHRAVDTKHCPLYDANAPPMGLHLRLKASYTLAHPNPTAQIIVTAMQKYGIILADNGSDFFFQGERDTRWNDDDLNALKSIPANAFEAIDVSSLKP